jgi:hypothetical protein
MCVCTFSKHTAEFSNTTFSFSKLPEFGVGANVTGVGVVMLVVAIAG